jgi:hypothetical protein
MAKNNNNKEADSTYILKLVLYLIIGSFWIKINTSPTTVIPIPLGVLIGLLFARHDSFRIDRKIEYAVLLVAMFLGYWAPLGLNIYTF